MDEWMDQYIDWSNDLWVNWLTDRCIDQWINGSIDWSMDWSIDGLMDDSIDGLIDVSIDGSIYQCIDGWIDLLIDGWIDRSMDRSIEWSMDGWMDGSMDGWMDGSIKWSMNQWTVHLNPSSIFFDPPWHHWLYRQQYFPPSKGYCQRGLSLLRIRIGCPTGILIFFGMEEFVCEGGRRQPSRADRNNDLV